MGPTPKDVSITRPWYGPRVWRLLNHIKWFRWTANTKNQSVDSLEWLQVWLLQFEFSAVNAILMAVLIHFSFILRGDKFSWIKQNINHDCYEMGTRKRQEGGKQRWPQSLPWKSTGGSGKRMKRKKAKARVKGTMVRWGGKVENRKRKPTFSWKVHGSCWVFTSLNDLRQNE